MNTQTHLIKARLNEKDILLTPEINGYVTVFPQGNNKKEPYTVPAEHLNLAYARGKLVYVHELADEFKPTKKLSDKDQLAQDILLQYVFHFLKCGSKGSRKIAEDVIRQVAVELGDSQPPSSSTLLRAAKNYLEYGNIDRKVPVCPQRCSDKAYELFDAIIDDMYLKINGASKKECWLAYSDESKKPEYIGLKFFSRSTFYDRIKKLPRTDVIRAREGKNVSRTDSRIVERGLITNHVLERIEMDAVHVNVGLKGENEKIVTQIIIYVVMDCHSRAILGTHVQVAKYHGEKKKTGETKFGITQSIVHSLQPKPNMSFDGGKYFWPMRGTGEVYVTDGGGPYASHVIGGLITSAGGDQQITEPGSGYRKPYVERFFSTLRTQFLSVIPGYMGKRTDGKQFDLPIHKHASVTLREFESLLANYLVTRYHQAPHKGLMGLSPQKKWEKSINKSTTALKVPDIGRLVRRNIEPIPRTIQAHLGIQINNTFFNSKVLKSLFDMLTDKGDKNPVVECIYTPLEPGHAWVKNPFGGKPIKLNAKYNGKPYKNHIFDPIEEEVLGADIPFSFNHPIIADARELREEGFKQHQENKVTRELNTKAIADQASIIKDDIGLDLPPSFEFSNDDEDSDDALDQYGYEDDEFDGVDIDDK